MQSKRYLFIDGAYVREEYARFTQFWFEGNGSIDYATLVESHKPDKCFYYDCFDDKQRPSETQQEFEARVANQKRIFSAISNVPLTHVRFGTLKGANNKRRQKEVDILIAVDMMNHAARKNMDEAIFMAGDMDFTALVESLVELGVTVTLRADKRTVAEELKLAADTFVEITVDDHYSWSPTSLRLTYPLPEVVRTSSRPIATVLKTGHLGDDVCMLFPAHPVHIIYVESFRGGSPLRVKFHDLERLERFCETQYGKLQWD